MVSFKGLWEKRSSTYPAMASMSIAGYEVSNIEKAFEVLSDEEAELLFRQMNYFAEMTYDDLLERYGEASYKGAPFYAYIGYKQIPVHGRMKLYQNNTWCLYDMKIEETQKQEKTADPIVEDIPESNDEVTFSEDYEPYYGQYE